MNEPEQIQFSPQEWGILGKAVFTQQSQLPPDVLIDVAMRAMKILGLMIESIQEMPEEDKVPKPKIWMPGDE